MKTTLEDIVSIQCPEPLQFLKDFFAFDIAELFYDDFFDLLSEQHYWLKIKNKKVFYNHNIKALFPDLAVFTPQSSPTTFPCPLYTSLHFEGYQGEIMTRDDFLFSFSVSYYDYLVETFHFKKYDYFTIEEDFYIDSHCTYSGDWGNFSLNLSHHIPVYKFEPEENTISLCSHYVSLLYLLQEGLIPEGLSPESELTYDFLLNIFTINPSIYAIDQWDDLVFREDKISQQFLSEIEPLIEKYLLEKVKFTSFAENTQPQLRGNPSSRIMENYQ